jgi:transcriptional antiterminator RfaH
MQLWYVVHTRPRAEDKALRHLTDQGFEVYLPRYLRRRSHARKVERVAAPLFPRYLFVHLDIDRTRWRAIASTVGVNHFVCHGDRPVPLPTRVIEEVRGREDSAGFVRNDAAMTLRPGTAVRVVDGPLTDLEGLFEAASDEHRVAVLMSILGRNVRIELPVEAIAACG